MLNFLLRLLLIASNVLLLARLAFFGVHLFVRFRSLFPTSILSVGVALPKYSLPLLWVTPRKKVSSSGLEFTWFWLFMLAGP